MTEIWTAEDLSGQSVLITGASRGIGAAAARAFAARGARVALIARDGDRLAALADEIGGLALGCDVADAAALRAAIAQAEAAHGGLDVLINNAALIAPIGMLEATDPAEWSTLIDVNIKGVYYAMHAALPGMRARGRGTIINLSSGAAHNPLEGWSAYCASKAAVAMLTRAADLEARAAGLRIMGLSPGTVQTDMQVQIRASGINRIAQLEWSDHSPPEWVGQVLLWMASRDADAWIGREVALRDPQIMARLGLSREA